MDNEFPPNSNSEREARPRRQQAQKGPEKKDVQRVVTGRVIQREKPLRKKFLEAFRPEDNKGFVEYTLIDVLVPGIKDAMANAVNTLVENALGVGPRPSRGHRRRSGGSYTSYNRMGAARRDRDDDRRDRRPSRGESARVGDDVKEIILESRIEAEGIVDNLFELISMYDVASMRDLMTMLGEPFNPVHEDWGWTDLRGARVHRIREGYLIDLPRPEPLD